MKHILYLLSVTTIVISTFLSAEVNAADEDCKQCHEQETHNWSVSHHAKAMDVATPESVLGDFNNVKITHQDQKVHFYQDKTNYWVSLTEAGSTRTYQIDYVFGFEPLQQYLIKFDSGHYQVFPYTWDSRPETDGGQRWYHIYGDDEIKPDDRLHWRQPLQSWNGMCADCHSVGLVRNYDATANSFNTTYDDINVSCNACHEIADNHAQTYTKSDPVNVKVEAGKWVLTPGEKVAKWHGPERNNTFMDNCYACHSLRTPLTDGFTVNKPFLDQFSPELPRAPLYYADGQIREEVYVYASFLQSKMHQAGVNCMDCHDKHTLEIKVEGNGLCLQCHSAIEYQTDEHLRHKTGTAGAQCVDCHMPDQRYMGVDDRRDHSFSSPKPHLSGRYEIPNACTQCHEDKSNAWAATTVRSWYGGDVTLSKAEQDYIRLMSNEQITLSSHLALINSKDVSAIKRASAVAMLPHTTDHLDYETGIKLTQSKEPLIRLAVARVGFLFYIYDRENILKPLLNDSYKAIRTAAANELVGLDLKSQQYKSAISELLSATEITRWRGEGSINLSQIYTRQGRYDKAVTTLVEGIKIDPYFAPNYINLADIYRQNGEIDKERKLYSDAISKIANSDVFNYSYGLHLIRDKKNQEAKNYFLRATQLGPNDPRFAIAYTLTLDALGQTEFALNWLIQHKRNYPNNTDIKNIGLSFSQKLGRWQDLQQFKN